MGDERLDLNPDADDQKILAQVVGYYHRALKADEDALKYLRGRGITATSAVDHFRIGYADRSLGTKLPSKDSKTGRAIRARLQKLGLFRDSGHEHLRGSITLPIPAADGTGRIVDVSGRLVLGKQLRKGTVLDLHLGDGKAGVFNVEAFGATDEIVLCSSPFDALTFWVHGYRNATCMFGTNALTDDLLAACKEFGIRRVLTTSEIVVPKLLAAGLEAFTITLPLGLDVNAFAVKTKDPADALGGLLRNAGWEGRGKVSTTGPTPAAPRSHAPAGGAAGVVEADDPNEEEVAEPAPVDPPKAETPPEPVPVVRTASPAPPAPTEVEAEVTGTEVVLTFGTRRYRVRGLDRNATPDVLRVNVMASNGVGMFLDTFDLYSAKHRTSFQTQAATELNVEEATVKTDIGRVLLKLEEMQDTRFREAEKVIAAGPEMTTQERADALALLRDPNLLDRVATDFQVVGERTNKLVGYLAAVSRKLDHPLAVLIQSTSAAGKTTMMEAVLSMVPPEDVVKFSAMTGQSLYYMREGNLKHRILAIVEEEGAAKASYALKLLQSEGELRIASTGKEAASGRLTTQEYRVEGPTMLFLTTTSISVDEELLNRCVVLTVDEDREQTRAIHALQRRRETLEGMLAAQCHNTTLALHRNAQRLLRPLIVVNPFAERLTFLDARTRTRRDHQKYLTLIRTVTLLHQHQRPVRTVEHQGKNIEFIEVTLADIERANELAGEILGRCLDDLPPQTRALLVLIDGMVKAACGQEEIDRAEFRFSRRQVRVYTGWGDTQLKLHLKRLADLEYLLVHHDREARRHLYELLYTPTGTDRAVPGLLDVAVLRRCTATGDGGDQSGPEAHRSGENGDRSGDGRPTVGPRSPGGRGEEPVRKPRKASANPRSRVTIPKHANTPSKNGKPAS
jgi:DNA-directed RNA polymerase specialized sigma24 family protein